MVKAYLKYEKTNEVGTISSGPVIFMRRSAWFSSAASLKQRKNFSLPTHHNDDERDPIQSVATSSDISKNQFPIIATAALENVHIFDVKKNVLLSKIFEHISGYENPIQRGCVESLATNRESTLLAVGFFDGSIQIWNISRNEPLLQSTLTGHRRAVTVLSFNSNSSLLISASRDNSIVVWDMISETGQFKLLGHQDAITDFVFCEKSNMIISSSKDSFVKVWDLDTQHCIQTLVGHRNEVWSLALSEDETRLISGSVDDYIRIWSLVPEEFEMLRNQHQQNEADRDESIVNDEEKVVFIGKIRKMGKGKIQRLRFNSKYLLSQTPNAIHIFDYTPRSQIDSKSINPQDELKLKTLIKTEEKIKGFDISPSLTTIIISTAGNDLSYYTLANPPSIISSTTLPGHRSLIRSLCLSSDDALLLSCSSDQLKLWSLKTKSPLKTMNSGNGVTVLFAPGNRHAILGTKEGDIEIYDLGSAQRIGKIKAHEGSVASLEMSPDRSQVVSAGDSTIKFWDFILVETESKTKNLSIELNQTLTMSREALWVRYSSEKKFLAVSLLDNTVKIFFGDSLKFFLSLYGHKLPVLAFDFSHDQNLVVTASADKNIKLWGTDFGDCHKSIFAHDDSIVQVKFVAKTHYFFTCSKDRTLKYFDGDSYQHIQTLEGHHEPVWSLAVSSTGNFVISGSQDKSIRFWDRTEEQIFLQEESNRFLEKTLEKQDLIRDDTQPESHESIAANKTTSESLKDGERLMEALELCYEEKLKVDAYELEKKTSPNVPPPQLAPQLFGNSPTQYVLSVMKKIRPNNLELAISQLPFALVPKLALFLQDPTVDERYIELITRAASFMIRIHGEKTDLTFDFDSHLRYRLTQTRDEIGFNLAAIQFLKSEIEEETSKDFYIDSAQILKKVKAEKKNNKKKGF